MSTNSRSTQRDHCLSQHATTPRFCPSISEESGVRWRSAVRCIRLLVCPAGITRLATCHGWRSPDITSVPSWLEIFREELRHGTHIRRKNMSQTVFNDDAKTPVAREDVELAVRTALADALERPVDEILPQNDLENDLGLDSLGLIQVNVAIEEQFHIPILDSESPEFALHTVEDLTTFVADKAETTRSYQEE